MRDRSLKQQHEIAIGNALLREIGQNAHFIPHGIDGVEPDLIYDFEGKITGIEIATAYYDDHQAKLEWELARGNLRADRSGIIKIKGPGDWTGERYKLIAHRVQLEIDDKCAKTYSAVASAWLCIEQHAPLSDVLETVELVSNLRIPSRDCFERIYLCAHAHAGDGGGFRVYDLLKETVP